jgi:hypothetical protein
VRSTHALSKAFLLFDAGARIDVWNHCGVHPLHWAANSSFTDCLAWLLDRGADPNVEVRAATELQVYPVGWTPLHLTASRGLLEATDFLLARGGDPNRRSADGGTPLHVAARQFRVYKRLIRHLLDAGANPNIATNEGATPMHDLAAGSGRYRKGAIKLLRSRGARIDARDALGRLPVELVPDGYPATEAIRRLLTVRPES